MRVSEAGGEPQPITAPPLEEGRHAWPRFMPDGRSVLFTTGPDAPLTSRRVALLSLETNEQTVLTAGTAPSYLPPGYLVFGREESLWAARFDPERPASTGEPTPIVEAVHVQTANAAVDYALADNGMLAYEAPQLFGGTPHGHAVRYSQHQTVREQSSGGVSPADATARATDAPVHIRPQLT